MHARNAAEGEVAEVAACMHAMPLRAAKHKPCLEAGQDCAMRHAACHATHLTAQLDILPALLHLAERLEATGIQ